MKIGAPAKLDDSKAYSLYAAACAGLIGFSASFVGAATMEGLSLPWYEPLQRRWQLAISNPTLVSMDWYSRVGISLASGLALAAVTYFVARRRTPSATLLRAASIWALAITLIGLFLYAWTLGNRVILPPGA